MLPVNDLEIKTFNSIYYFEFGKDFSHPPEKHDSWEMVYVDKGEIIAITDGVGCSMAQGQVIFHEPDEVHAHISNKEVANNMLVVSFQCDSKEMEFFRKKTFTLDRTSKTLLSLFVGEAKEALGKLPGDYNNKKEPDFAHGKFGAGQLMKYHFTEFLIKLIRTGSELGDKIQSSHESKMIAKNSMAELISEFLRSNIYESVVLDDICNQFYIGKTQLNGIFSEYMGTSPIQYYNHLKIEESKKLIREDNYSISQISELLHYSGVQNFSRTFKKTVGFSPAQYKKSIL